MAWTALRLIGCVVGQSVLMEARWVEEIGALVRRMIHETEDVDRASLCGVMAMELVAVQYKHADNEKTQQLIEAVLFLLRNKVNLLVKSHAGLVPLVRAVISVQNRAFWSSFAEELMAVSEHTLKGYPPRPPSTASKINVTSTQKQEAPALTLLYSLKFLGGVRFFFQKLGKELVDKFLNASDQDLMEEECIKKLVFTCQLRKKFECLKTIFALLGLANQKINSQMSLVRLSDVLVRTFNIYLAAEVTSFELVDEVLLGFASSCAVFILRSKNSNANLSYFGSAALVYSSKCLCFTISLSYPLKDVIFIEVQQILFRESVAISKACAILFKENSMHLVESGLSRIYSTLSINYVLWRESLYRNSIRSNSIQDSLVVKDRNRPSVTFLTVATLLSSISDRICSRNSFIVWTTDMLSLLEFARVKYNGYFKLFETICVEGDNNEQLRNKCLQKLLLFESSESATKIINATVGSLTLQSPKPFGKPDRPCIGREFFKMGVLLRWMKHFDAEFIEHKLFLAAYCNLIF